MSEANNPQVLSLCVVAYNEEEHLPNLLKDFCNQTYPRKFLEIVLIDGKSSDHTLQIMNDFAKKNYGFYGVQVLNNPKRIQAAGWNVAFRNFKGDVIARIDAHTRIHKDFAKNVMADIAKGEDVVGGIRPCLCRKKTPWAKVLLQTENSLFGSSINSVKHSSKKSYVKTCFHPAYRRKVIETAGLMNEDLLRTEDNEFHYRVGEKGFRILYDPKIKSYQFMRSSFKSMLKQKFGNGYWIGYTLGVCPGCISPYHLVPFAFLLSIIFTSILAIAGYSIWALLLWICYGLFAVGNTVISAKQNGFYIQTLLMPVLFLSLHLSYGIGTGWGLIKLLKNEFTSNKN